MDADTEGALQFASSHTHVNSLGNIDYDMLGAVEVCGAVTFVLCLLDSSFFIAFIEFLDDVCIQLLDSLLERRQRLDSTNRALVTIGSFKFSCNLNLNTYLEEFMRAEKGWLEILSSMGRLTEGMGTLEIPLS